MKTREILISAMLPTSGCHLDVTASTTPIRTHVMHNEIRTILSQLGHSIRVNQSKRTRHMHKTVPLVKSVNAEAKWRAFSVSSETAATPKNP
jgi:hypothetical protein